MFHQLSPRVRACVRAMEFAIDSCVRGHHVSKTFWSPTLGEELLCEHESGNPTDPYAVAVLNNTVTVRHVPRKISATCSLFLRNNGTILCTITGSRRFSAHLPQGGLEVRCKLKFSGEAKFVEKIRKLLTPIKSNNAPASVDVKASTIPPPEKKRKVASDDIIIVDGEEVDDNQGTAWLSLNNIILTHEDRRIIVKGEELNDKHIDFDQTLLKKQFQGILGLNSTLLLSTGRKPPLLASGALQIIHTRVSHWIVASTIGCTANVMVFDTLYSDMDKPTRELLWQLFGADVEVTLENAPRQQGLVCLQLPFAQRLCMASF